MKEIARNLRKNLTEPEQHLWHHLRKGQIQGFRFRRQVPIGKYIVDFVCFEKRLIIEIDGGQHVLQKDEDDARTEWLESEGFKVVRFWNHDVLKEINSVKEVILHSLSG